MEVSPSGCLFFFLLRPPSARRLLSYFTSLLRRKFLGSSLPSTLPEINGMGVLFSSFHHMPTQTLSRPAEENQQNT